jgi:hypothetical protein
VKGNPVQGPNAPLVSIVLAVDRQRTRGEGALASILAQPKIDACEVLLFDFGRDRHPPLAGSDHPSVMEIPLRRGWTYGMFRAYGAVLARGSIVAFLEEHARAGAGWLEGLLATFDTGVVGVGGVPSNGNPQYDFSKVVFLLYYRDFLALTQATDMELVPGHNSAYRRSVLRSLPVETLETEPTLAAAVLAGGGRLVVTPAVPWQHLNESHAGTLVPGFFAYGRLLGSSLPVSLGWSWAERIRRIARTPLTPPFRWLKLLRASWTNPELRRAVLMQTPAILLVESAQALGVAVGLLWGAGDAPRRFFDYELNARRD